MRDLGDRERLRLPIHEHVRVVLVRPHYPENLGAAARALKAMGFFDLAVVKPSRLCVKEHEMAFKMAVKSWDVLEATRSFDSVDAALNDRDLVVATTARRGVSGIVTARELARELVERVEHGKRAAILFGNEKTGLSDEERAGAALHVRIPMAADQPSINLAQAVQIITYELLCAALEHREHARRAEPAR